MGDKLGFDITDKYQLKWKVIYHNLLNIFVEKYLQPLKYNVF